MEPKQISEILKCEFSEKEIGELGLKMAREVESKVCITAEKKKVVKDYDAQLAGADATLGSLSTKLNNGYEMRDTACEVTFDTPSKGQKRVVRLDTGEVVRVMKMEQWETQRELGLGLVE